LVAEILGKILKNKTTPLYCLATLNQVELY